MTPSDPHTCIASALAQIAPDVNPDDLGADLHDDLGLDSMDLLNLAAAITDRSGIEIPERDYSKLRTIRQLEAFLADRAAQLPGPTTVAE